MVRGDAGNWQSRWAQPLQGSDDLLFTVFRGSTTRLTFDGGDEFNPVWSHDGARIMYASNQAGVFAVYRRGLLAYKCTNRPKMIAIVMPTTPTTSAPAMPTTNGLRPTPLNTAKLVFKPTAAIAVPSSICDAQ